jgi:hypothetical protein
VLSKDDRVPISVPYFQDTFPSSHVLQTQPKRACFPPSAPNSCQTRKILTPRFSRLKLLLKHISAGSGDAKLDQYLQSRDSYAKQTPKSVIFDNLWTIFAPGTIVYGQPFLKEPQIFIVQDNLQAWSSRSSSGRKGKPWSMACWSYDWDGKFFQRKSLRIKIEPFEGPKPISSLPYYPFVEKNNCDATREELKNRGVKFRRYCSAERGARMFEYDGETIFLKKGIRGIYTEESIV